MRKILLFVLFLSSVTYGQKIIVTPEGLKNAEDPEKSFIVILEEGKTAKQLFDSASKYLVKAYANPEQAIKAKVENEYIRFNTHAPNFITIRNSFAKVPITADYLIELSFKDGKIKFEVTSIDMYDKSGKFKLLFKGEGALSGYYVYNMKDELKKPEAKTEIESYFNALISNLKENLKKEPEDQW